MACYFVDRSPGSIGVWIYSQRWTDEIRVVTPTSYHRYLISHETPRHAQGDIERYLQVAELGFRREYRV